MNNKSSSTNKEQNRRASAAARAAVTFPRRTVIEPGIGAVVEPAQAVGTIQNGSIVLPGFIALNEIYRDHLVPPIQFRQSPSEPRSPRSLDPGLMAPQSHGPSLKPGPMAPNNIPAIPIADNRVPISVVPQTRAYPGKPLRKGPSGPPGPKAPY